MSKIQKAIQDIQKKQSLDGTPSAKSPLGRVVDSSTLAATSGGNLSPDVSALQNSKPARSIEVDVDALRADGFMVPHDDEPRLIDEYRQIKRPLIAHAFGKRATKIQDGHLILVSSALSGDGKTFTCINLALSIAREQDRSVLLVDADVAKAHVSRLFGAYDEPGLLDVLESDSEHDLNDIILGTDIDGFSIITAGRMRPHSTELLASERMESLIRVLSAQDPNRIVLFDSSPLLATSESQVMTSLVGQIVLVVAAEQTPQNAVMDAIANIDENKPVNLILNLARHNNTSGYYGYGYGKDSESEKVDDD